MIESGEGAGAALEVENWNCTRPIKATAVPRRTVERYGSFFMGIILHSHFAPALLQEN
jgi:hypothetical protein